MTVRLRLALVIVLTGLATAVGVIAAVVVAFQRFEHENTWQRANAFLGRVVTLHDDLLDRHIRDPEGLAGLLQNLLLFEPDSQLYLLDSQGSVLAHTGQAQLPRGFRVALAPVRQAIAAGTAGDGLAGAYVMGDDPEHMESDTVVAARALRRSLIRAPRGDEGFLYLVCRKSGQPAQRLALLRNSVVMPALASVAAVCLLAALLGAWTIVKVTRPLRVLSDEVAAVARSGFGEGFDAGPVGGEPFTPPRHHDELTRLRGGFQALLSTLRMQWDELQRLDRFRRESVSNLSHDLRSPLTATVACLETLEKRWQGDDLRLIEVALRNTRNAAGMVRSLGDLALLDEPQFQLHPMRLDLAEVMDDIALRFADRAARQEVDLAYVPSAGASPVATVDVELFERAVANLLDNALKFTPSGGRIVLTAERVGDSVRVGVQDSGSGIPPADLPHLFDRLYQSRSSVAPAARDEGKGLGLAIVKRIAELHGGDVSVASTPGAGTTVTLSLQA